MVILSPFLDPSNGHIPLSKLADRYDGLLCDIWGVLHNGVTAFDDAVDALRKYQASGRYVVLITNAPRSSKEIYPHLARFGVPRDAFNLVVTSGDVTGKVVAQNPDAPLFHVGAARDKTILAGVTNPIVGMSDAKQCLLTGPLDDTLETVEIHHDCLVDMRKP